MYQTAFLDLPPLMSAAGRVRLPGSKSISNRVLLLAALSAGCTTLHEVLESDDTQVMLAALRALGCRIDATGAQTLQVHGLGGQLVQRQAQLFLGNAGTAMRPLTAALALLAATQGAQFELAGVARMHERPIGDLLDALRQLGCPVQCLGQEGYPPLRVGDGARHALRLDEAIRVRGDVSSQFLTALLLALPLVSAQQAIAIEVQGELISKPYIDITLAMLARFGVQVQREGWQRFVIPAGSQYRSPGALHVEADASSASYFLALGAIAPPSPGSAGLRIEGVWLDSIQGDIRFVDAVRAMGAEVEGQPNALLVRRARWPLRAIDLDCNHIPDAAMTLAVLALYADGPSVLRNIASWRVKETDRLAAMACELRKLGAQVEEGSDYLRIEPLPADGSGWRSASIHTYDDHRVAMCFALAAFNHDGAPVRIEDPACVAKTFPDYFEALFSAARADTPHVPVICVDGPTASGKGTLASLIAQQLGYHYLDSGALYRIAAFAARRAGLELDIAHEQAVARLAQALSIRFEGSQVFLDGEHVSEAIRTEEAGMDASRVSALPAVRTALVALQQGFRRLPGLVADGRDMGTVIFPDAPLKVYLTASAAQRAERRHKQLISKGIPATIDVLRADLEARDARDSFRAVAPLKPAEDALLLDNSSHTIEESVALVLRWWDERQPFGSGRPAAGGQQ